MARKTLKSIMLQAGRYYTSGQLFYQRLWRNHLQQIGFRVIYVERMEEHPLWVLRVRITSSAQLHLLASSPAASKLMKAEDPFEHQLQAEILRMCKLWGPTVRKDELTLDRQGAYYTIAFLWTAGVPGRLCRKEKAPEAFSLLIRSWLKKVRN